MGVNLTTVFPDFFNFKRLIFIISVLSTGGNSAGAPVRMSVCGKWKVLANLVIMFGRYKQHGSCFCSVVFSVLFEKDLFCFYTYNQIEIYYIEQWIQELSSPDQSSICSVEVFVIGYLQELICIFQTTSHLESKFPCFHFYYGFYFQQLFEISLYLM